MSTTVYVFTRTRRGGGWSRYTFPFDIEVFAQLGNVLYIKHGDFVSVVDTAYTTDDDEGVAGTFAGSVQWPWMDVGTPGLTKMMEGVDVVCQGQVAVSIGYDQTIASPTNAGTFTSAHTMTAADTLAGTITPFAVSGPSLSIKLTFTPGFAWKAYAVTMYLHDNQMGA